MCSAPLRTWTHAPLSPEVERALRRLCRLDDVALVAAMPDVHLAADVCVGTVVGTRSRLLPAAVGGDLGCGMAALRVDAEATLLDDPERAAALLRGLAARVPTGSHPSASAALPGHLSEVRLSAPILEKKKQTIGRVQLGTLGRGNHFVELQRDDAGALWLMLHSGSRGMGQAIRDQHAPRGGLAGLEAASPEGEAYLHDHDWALAYARTSRRRMVEAVAALVKALFGVDAAWETFVDCAHNLVRREAHEGQLLWVHRKGAIPAADGEPGIIPGSMGTASFHVVGRGHAPALCSSSHGAGRAMSRSEARQRISPRRLAEEMRGIWYDHRLTGRLRDEAPAAYKDIGAVMRAQRELTRVVRRLEPLLVYKGA